MVRMHVVMALAMLAALPVGAQERGPWTNNPVVRAIKVNQAGYRPDAVKVLCVTAGTVAEGAEGFVVKDGAGKVALEGKLSAEIDDTASTGERVMQGDFSAVRTPGEYTIEVARLPAARVRVGPEVYVPLYRDAARAFYLIRASVAIDDAVTGIKLPAAHPGDARVLVPWTNQRRDLTGGWYNAADYGKWAHMAAISASYMMLLHELKGEAVTGIRLQIPESGNAVPDLLDQARWGIEWMLKLQNADGSVVHKVDSGPVYWKAYGKLPEHDAMERVTCKPSSIDPAVFVATMARAARVFAPYDRAFAQRCQEAIPLSRKWLAENPKLVHDDPAYVDADPTQEILWADAELAASGDAEAVAEFVAAKGRPLGAVYWMSPEMLGYFSVARSEKVDKSVRAMAREAILRAADELVESARASGYRVAYRPNEYWWESNETLLHRAAALIMAYELSKEAKYRDAAGAQLDYILGVNSLGISFVTGFGERAVQRPYHWYFAATGNAFPGWVSGGPNAFPAGADEPLKALQAKKTPPAKCFLDTAQSWASNEGETSANAALVFVAGWFVPGR